ncbi:MAG: Na+/H+ antiporter subunit E [Actinomycetota bacterium]
MDKKTLILIFSLWIFWIILTASFKVAILIIGLILSFFVAILCRGLLAGHMETIKMSRKQFGRFILYVPYLITQIIKANIDVAERVLDPRLPISPIIIRFKFPLDSHLAQITMANSITLTPGTLTVDIQDNTFFIHCLAEEHAESIFGWDLQEHVIGVYEEKER